MPISQVYLNRYKASSIDKFCQEKNYKINTKFVISVICINYWRQMLQKI